MAKTIYVNNHELTDDSPFTYLNQDVVSAGSTIRVQSLIGFHSLTTSSGQIIMVGELGNENTEIIKTSSSTALSTTYNEVTLNSNLLFNHPQDTKVWIINFDRFEIQHAATATGAKSTIAAYPFNIQPDQDESQYRDSSQSAGFYFVRWNETVGNTNSDWSDAVPYAGYDDNTVFAIKKRALDELGEKIDDSLITNDFLNSSLWEARREYHQRPGKRPFRRVYNYVLGKALTGSAKIELPDDVESPYSAENIYGIRIGTNPNLTYYDKKEWDNDYIGVPSSFLTTAYSVGNQDLYVDSVDDFTDSGSVSVEGTSIGYSARGISGGTLRISTAGTWGASAGSTVWQNASYGLPLYFTVFFQPVGSAYVYFDRPIDTAYINLNIYSDYYRTLVGYDSDADVLDEPSYDMYVNYLKAMIKAKKAKGNYDVLNDSDFLEWQRKLTNALTREYLGTEIRVGPDIGHLPFKR